MSEGTAKTSGIPVLAHAPQREMRSFALYRILEAGLLAGLLFSPLSGLLTSTDHFAVPSTVAVFYALFAVAMLLLGHNERKLVPTVLAGAVVDVLVAATITYTLPQTTAGVAMLLLFNVAAACTLLPMRWAVIVAAGAALIHFTEYLLALFFKATMVEQPVAEVIMLCISYTAVGLLAAQIGRRARASQQLADQRGEEVANLVHVNELIIRRMRTGVLVVDAEGRIKLANEAASLLLGDGGARPDGSELLLPALSPELGRRLQRWLNGLQNDESPIVLSPDQPEVQPRFIRLLAGNELSVVFLDDTSVVSKRAESLTLATLGRFSASLAHEIRNPLAAINYAVQLLEESQNFNASDRHLLSIIHQQCRRTNGIVESVLSLARRERANPERTDLNAFARRFVDEYRHSLSIETDSLETVLGAKAITAMVDPRHLHQVVTVLVQNAFIYGRLPSEPARVRLRVFALDQRAMIDVLDRGPGIPAAVAAQLFRPFYTTSEHGTGLGLYIARELCRANQSTLDYVAVPGGGCCFRIAMPGPGSLLARGI